ncbi:replication initiator protein A [Komagataeibacter sp. AV436]|uniref:Replication initiator protein A n=1 Tax=Komagataeibacter melomenusus TaxID=2766578 RepID=A0ABX2ADN6_9PROT|nr:replication initiator protein A [Komagataeibacter melomenusus]MBV1829087.1 replication initiator protein A [Komagataeibacter melomenusus]NPC65762.1 replication initiator protein A [Komagataeibacter melomenusus]
MAADESWREPDRRFVVSGPASPRDQRDLMGRPFFALARRPRFEPIRYRSRQINVIVRASADEGMATIWDADVLLWLAGQIVEALNHGRWVSRHVRFTPWQLFHDLGWADGAHQYRRLRGALVRLETTRIATSLRTPPDWPAQSFAWISDLGISRTEGVSLTLPIWFMEGVCDCSRVLTLDPAYFRLAGGLERWLYRLARRHAGRQKAGWTFDVAELHARSGSLTPLRNFMIDIGTIVRRQSIPGYDFQLVPGGKPGVLRIVPTGRSTVPGENHVDHTVASDAEHTVGAGAELPLLQVQKPVEASDSKGENGPVTYITNIITYYVGNFGLSDTFPIGRSGHGKKAREVVTDRMVGVP